MDKKIGHVQRSKKKKTSIRTISEDYAWKTLGFLCKDLKNLVGTSLVMVEELKILSSIVRQRDLQRYLITCKARWALKSMDTIASALQNENQEWSVILQFLRIIRIFTIFQKYLFEGNSSLTRQKAFDTFKTYELLCCKTNKDPIFKIYDDTEDSDEISTYDNLVTCKVLSFMKQRIQEILGCVPDLDTFCANLRHGPGATSDKRGEFSIPVEKWVPPFSCTKSAEKFFLSAISADKRWIRSINDADCNLSATFYYEKALQETVKRTTCSVLHFVRKTAETDRTITIEPTANMFLQLGANFIIRQGLLDHGIDLSTQEKNQELAKRASIDDSLVTIDLSSASDSLSLVLLDLFPPRWREFLLTLRTHYTLLDNGEFYPLAKISAMGNGYTFALETVIFHSLVYATHRVLDIPFKKDDNAVYGDDIIVPKEIYGTLSYLLHRLGLRENVDKTFSRGPVRESCGMDYFKGFRIDRPTIKRKPTSNYELCIDHNSFYTLCNRYGFELPSVLSYISSHDPKPCYGPEIEDLCSWYFTKNPGQSFCSKTQTLGYRTRRFIVSHPKIKPRKNNYRNFFEPMCYLTRSQEKETVPKATGRFVVAGDLLSFCRHVDDETLADSPFFLKKRKNVRHVHVFVPIYMVSQDARK